MPQTVDSNSSVPLRYHPDTEVWVEYILLRVLTDTGQCLEITAGKATVFMGSFSLDFKLVRA